MTWSDDIAARCKGFEAAATTQRADRGRPVLARLDGRAFHTYTHGMTRPYDPRLSQCMIETAKALVDKNQAIVGYTQSDEITLLFWVDDALPSSCLPFDGRIQKLTSVLAGFASARFAQLAWALLPEKQEHIPHFDCRVWQVPTTDDAIEAFAWRMHDARKNSVSMAAQAHYSHRQLLNVDTRQKLELLRPVGVDWSTYPDFFRVGTFVRRVVADVVLDEAARLRIPEKHRPAAGVAVPRSRMVCETPPETLTWPWLLGRK